MDARVIGAGRAGGAMAGALRRAGWAVEGPLGRDHDAASATAGVDLVLLAVPDAEVGPLARSLAPGPAVVVHLAGALGLDVLAPHRRVASLHPLVALPDPVLGAERLVGAWFARAGDPLVDRVVDALGGRSVLVAEDDRVIHHATAVVAANHLVALMGQVERLAARIGVPVEAYLELARGALANVADLGAGPALTGPVARGDWDTVGRHVQALPETERLLYTVLADAARRVAEGEATAGGAPPGRPRRGLGDGAGRG